MPVRSCTAYPPQKQVTKHKTPKHRTAKTTTAPGASAAARTASYHCCCRPPPFPPPPPLPLGRRRRRRWRQQRGRRWIQRGRWCCCPWGCSARSGCTGLWCDVVVCVVVCAGFGGLGGMYVGVFSSSPPLLIHTLHGKASRTRGRIVLGDCILDRRVVWQRLLRSVCVRVCVCARVAASVTLVQK